MKIYAGHGLVYAKLTCFGDVGIYGEKDMRKVPLWRGGGTYEEKVMRKVLL